MKNLTGLLLCFLFLNGCKSSPGGDTGDTQTPADSIDTLANSGEPADVLLPGSGTYWRDSLPDPKAWVNEEMLLVMREGRMDTFLLDGGGFHKSLTPALKAVQMNSKGHKEIVVDFTAWNMVNNFDTEAGEMLSSRDEVKKCIEVYDVDEGLLIFACCYYYNEHLEELVKDKVSGESHTRYDSTYYEYTVQPGAEITLSGLKGKSEPDLTPGVYVRRGNGYAKVVGN